MAVSRRSKIVVVLLMLVLVASFGIGIKRWRTSEQPDQKDYVNLLKQVMGLVKKSYIEPVEDKKLVESAINGMLASLDPHSTYLPPTGYKEMQVEMSGSFGGLGIEISIKDDKLTVVSPIEDTPAYRAGVKAGDHIFKIDDKFTRGMNITAAVGLMRGTKGTGVTLTILREGTGKPLVFPLVRDTILVKSLRSRMLEPGYGYVRISQFQERTGDDFVKALADLKKQSDGSLRGLVIDLRNNPGGLLDQAVRVADRFIGEGLSNGLVVYTKGRTPVSQRDYTAYIGDKEPFYPIVVLINGGSASASEILAGALQDHKRAIIMGTQSFGKGSVQSIIPLRNGGALKLTTARYYTPNGRSIQAKGIVPDVTVSRVDLTSAKPEEKMTVREKDLDNHILGTEKPATKEPPKPPAKPNPHLLNAPVTTPPATEKKPAEVPGRDPEVAKDYQLLRALELLHGLDIMKGLKKAS